MSPEKLHTESLLIREMQLGNQDAFTELYRYYSPILYNNILRMLRDPIATEELVQELFTRIWQKRESKGIAENFSGYMFRIAQNLVHDFFRRMKKDLVLQEKFKAHLIEGADLSTAEDLLQRQHSLGLINNAIEHLPPQQKKAYKLVRQEGYSYKKAAEDMGISPMTVKEYLTLANKSIRNYLFSKVDSPSEIILLVLICLSFL